jgi:hypothetical protein
LLFAQTAPYNGGMSILITLHMVRSAAMIAWAALAAMCFPIAAAAECVLEIPTTASAAVFTRHLPKSCSAEERASQSISSADLLQALREGKDIDLAGVVVVGDLMFDQLPITMPASWSAASPPIQEALRAQPAGDVRVIPGAISIRDSWVQGKISTNLKQGLIVLTGPISLTGTTFERTVDLSHAAFESTVDFSDARLVKEGFFIRAIFTQPVRFERTAFGVHARFHRATFKEPVTFLHAVFNGLSEFLEVSFEKDASFLDTTFKLGTGFSGSHFGARSDFSEATFDREAFYLFTQFDREAAFRRAAFHGTADFSDAEFKGPTDFSKVRFDVQPSFVRAKGSPDQQSLGGIQDPKLFYAIAAGMLVAALGLLLFLRRT